MADFVELANSYYRLLRWVEASEAEKKNTALRSLDRIKRFLTESNVEVVDLTGQPFSEGWAVKVMKIDDSVPENELVFTKMVKPIIQVNGELMQEGEVYVGKIELEEVKEETVEKAEETPIPTAPIEPIPDVVEDEPATKNPVADWFKKAVAKVKTTPITPNQWTMGAVGIVALILIILVACALGGQGNIRSDVAAVDKRVEELALVDYRNQMGSSIVTYEVRNGDNTIVVTQPIGEAVVSTVEINGVPVTITTNGNNANNEGE